jgi:hypothetical protein
MFLPSVFGLRGVFFAMPEADLGSVLLTACFMLTELKRLNRLIHDEKRLPAADREGPGDVAGAV